MTDQADEGYGGGGWTGALRRRAVRALPPEKLLPDRQPAYVSSWIYVFGVPTSPPWCGVLVSGAWLALAGPPGGTRSQSATSSTRCTCGASSCSSSSW